jgi:restriction endonuclease S subunit
MVELMITYYIIKKSQLERASRLDAEYYQPEYLERLKKLRLFPVGKLEDVAYITDGEHGSPIFDEKSGIKYFSAQHVRDGFIDDSDAKNISRIIDEKNKRSRLQKGDVLLSTVGTIGFAGLVTGDLLPANIDRHVARIALKEKIPDPHFLVAFLNSSFGRFQTIREATGNVQLNLFIDKIKELLVPKIDNEEVSQMVRSALQELKNSGIIYSQAEDLLLRDLGLKDFKPTEELSYFVNLSNVKSTRRVDAEYFQPKYRKIEEKLVKEFNAKRIKYLDFIKVTTGQYSEEYTTGDRGRPYIRGTDLTKGTVNLGNLVYIDPDRQIPSKKAKEGDVVVTRVGTIGISARLPKDVEGGTISDNLIRLRFPEETLNTYYVSLFFNTIGSQLMIRESRGSVQARLNQETLREIVLPILPKSTQQKVAALVRQSHHARKKAKDLLEKAKREVEEFIERK